MKYVRQGLEGLVMFCLIVRVAAWLLAPAFPLIVVLFLVLELFHLMIGRFRGL